MSEFERLKLAQTGLPQAFSAYFSADKIDLVQSWIYLSREVESVDYQV